jgi:hypothetical protein
VGPARNRPANSPCTAVPVLATSAEIRRIGTFCLFRDLALIRDVTAYVRPGALPGADQAQAWQARSEVLREQGHRDTLRRMWRLPEVRAVTSAVQGRLLPAYLWLTWHRRRCPDPAQALMLAETESRVIEHMARVPELHLLARRLTPGMIALLGTTSQATGVHLYRQHNDLAMTGCGTSKPRTMPVSDTAGC